MKYQTLPASSFSKLFSYFRNKTDSIWECLVGLPALFDWFVKIQFNKKQADVRRSLRLTFLVAAIFFQCFSDGYSQIVTLSGAASGNGSFTTLNTAFAIVNSSDQSGRTITITISGSTTEPSTLGAVLNAGNWITLSVVPSGSNRSIGGTINGGIPLVNLNGADNVTFDGLLINNNTTLANPGTCAIQFINDACKNTIKNCVVSANGSDNVSGIVLFSTTTGSTGNDSNLIQNNDIVSLNHTGANGIVNSGTGTTSATKNSGNRFIGNRIYDFDRRGVYDIGNSAGNLYDGNTINSNGSPAAPYLVGFEVQAGTIEGFTFRNNYIHDLTAGSNSITIYGMALWQIQSSFTGEIYNNFISLSNNNSPDLAGIHEGSPSNCNYNIYFNSIYIYGSVTGTMNSDCYYRQAANTNFKDNILMNARTGGTGKHYAIRMIAPLNTFASNYNDIYNTGGTGNVFGKADLTERTSLADWKTGTGKDSNSVSGDPKFVSTSNLHIDSATTSPVSNNGISIAGITTDYDGNARITSPDIGADEFTNPVIVSGAVNGNGAYATLSSAFNAINSFSQSGANILIQILSNTNEPSSGAVLIGNSWTSLTINPSSARTITGSVSAGLSLINLIGADNVTIDGLKTGGNSLTIVNTTVSATAGTNTIRFTNDASKNTVKNCIIMGAGQENTTGVISFSTTSGPNGNDTNTILNNEITRAPAGPPANCISNSGTGFTSAAKNSGNKIIANKLFDFQRRGTFDGGNSAGTLYEGNEIYTTIAPPGAPYLVGFEIFASSIDGFTCRSNYVHDLKISGALTIYGMALWDMNPSFTGDVYNNFISLSENNSNDLKGIHDGSPAGRIYNINFNSINIYGSATGVSNSDCYYRAASTTTNLKNNILLNSRTGGTGKHYAIRTVSPITSFVSNYNDIYNTGGTGNVFGKLDATERTTLAAWRTASGKDSNSISANPLFVSNTNLHIDSTASSPVNAAATPVAGITTDCDGNTRNALKPDIGADEFNVAAVTVSGANSGNGIYGTLTTAFNSINSFSQTGANILIQIINDYTEQSAGAMLNAGSWTSLTINPVGVRTISGSINAGSSLINLNGADGVTIDGLNSGGNSLVLSNTTVSSTAGTSTINLNNDASNNTITRCKILGSSTVATTSQGGVINFGTGSSTGNDNNVISLCDIGPAGSNLPSKTISFIGTSVNNADTIRDCNIYDFFSATISSAGIYAGANNSDLSFVSNKFFQTATRTHTITSLQHSPIWVDNTSGNNFKITGNTIGYSSSNGTGTYTLSGVGGTRLNPIYLNAGSTTPSSIQGNTIAAIIMTGSSAGTSINAPFIGILVSGGKANIGNVTGNIIGNLAASGSIMYTSSGSISEVTGIFSGNAVIDTIANNSIGGMSVTNTIGAGANVYGIRHASTGNSVCQNNIIGGTVANSIQSVSTNNFTIMIGIEQSGGPSILTGNIVRNMTASAGISDIGINMVGGSIHTVKQNIIYAISNTQSTPNAVVSGLVMNVTSTGNMIERNLIHSLSASSSTSATINGIYVSALGNSGYRNNIIRLGINSQGSGLNNGLTINGINEIAGSNNFYFNSVYIGGNPTSGSGLTFAFRSNVTSLARNYKDNIFYNARSNNGSTGKHYAILIPGNTVPPPGASCNYNLLYVSGTGGFTGLYNGVDRSDLSAWRSATGLDSNSESSNPNFVNPTGDFANLNLHIDSTASPVIAAGIPVAGINTDYDGDLRNILNPDIGADEFISAKIILDLTMLIEGFYDPSSNLQVSDTVKTYLRNSSSPYNAVDSSSGVVNDSGKVGFTFINAPTGNYYLQIKHRNALETWSGNSILKIQTGTTQYDFTTAASQAFGDNLKQVDASPVRFAIYSGDANQDGTIDVGDIVDIYNDVLAGNSGYLQTDINGDDFIDVSDLIIAYNNSINVVSVITP